MALIEQFLPGLPPVQPRGRNQFFIEALWHQQRARAVAERVGAWAASWTIFAVTMAVHMMMPCGECDGCRVNGLARHPRRNVEREP